MTGPRTPRIAGVDPAELEGPITSGVVTEPTDFLAIDLTTVGYVEEEWFASGTARSYRAAEPLGDHGRWSVEQVAAAPYRTRMVVRRPADVSTWNGTVVLEWFNVSGGFETPAEWSYTGPAIRDAGAAYVGVSAQALGILGGTGLMGAAEGIAAANPERYADLVHPGDQFSFDIVSQIAAALRSDAGAKALGSRSADLVIGSGESQSAAFLVTYINAFHPEANAFDGFFVHSRGGSAAGLDGSHGFDDVAEGAVQIRDDLDAAVLIFETETDVGPALGYAGARQPYTEHIRTWEVAGAAHADAYYVGGSISTCLAPINDGPHHYVAAAAMGALLRWVSEGTPPSRAAPIETTGTGTGTVIVRDAHGIALGGIRTPSVDVPISTLTGEAPPGGPSYCRMFGASIPFDRATLRSLYGSTADYRKAFGASLDRSVADGFIRAEDVDAYLAECERVVIPS